jgi:hypothetical protein
MFQVNGYVATGVVNFLGVGRPSLVAAAGEDTTTQPVEVAKQLAYTNHLIDSNNPCLLLHVHNPVEWYSWGAFRQTMVGVHVLWAAHHGRNNGICRAIFDSHGSKARLVIISNDYQQYDTLETTDYDGRKSKELLGFETKVRGMCWQRVRTERFGSRSRTVTARRAEGYGKPIVPSRVTVRVTERANRWNGFIFSLNSRPGSIPTPTLHT